MMPAKASKIRFMPTKTKVHVVTTPGNDKKHSKCRIVKFNHDMPVASGGWGRRPGISPDAALEMDECKLCGTHAVAEAERKARMTPAQKRAEAKLRAQDTQEKMRPKPLKGKKHKTDKPAARRGPRGGDVNDRMKALVEEHAEYATKLGWASKAWNSGANEWTAEASKDGDTLKLIYRDGRKVWARVVLSNGVEVRLRSTGNWKLFAAGQYKVNRDHQPRQTGKKAAKSEVIKDDVRSKLPFNLETDDEDTIIESLVGKRITWRNSISDTLDTAKVPTRARNCRIRLHPKSERLMISFFESQGMSEHGEMLGGERTVYLDKILKAR